MRDSVLLCQRSRSVAGLSHNRPRISNRSTVSSSGRARNSSSVIRLSVTAVVIGSYCLTWHVGREFDLDDCAGLSVRQNATSLSRRACC